MRTYLVVGASRGIGLGLVAELLKDGTTHVFATARVANSSTGLQELVATYSSRLTILECDATDAASVERAASDAAALLPDGQGLDCLIHNAAISQSFFTPFEQIDTATFQHELTTNIVGPLIAARAFLPLLRKSAQKQSSALGSESETKLVFVSSDLGSVEEAPTYVGLGDMYSVTKAGLGMLARKWGTSLKAEGICTVLLHPGYVDTDMASHITEWVKENKPHVPRISVEECATLCLGVIHKARIEDAVSFYVNDGSTMPW
ncbi:short-chain dehydrogenase [Fomitopsis schrenkii]|uniref:Short-chain dehydrogenase n=1 Tax=Fomitopsis schrenkii TaxID=2126942 RepID=S8F3L7_FOMSC|nr:short-chain dehydrogenase [Fomitopsis schrenkii]